MQKRGVAMEDSQAFRCRRQGYFVDIMTTWPHAGSCRWYFDIIILMMIFFIYTSGAKAIKSLQYYRTMYWYIFREYAGLKRFLRDAQHKGYATSAFSPWRGAWPPPRLQYQATRWLSAHAVKVSPLCLSGKLACLSIFIRLAMLAKMLHIG